jgi:hypothetical protein
MIQTVTGQQTHINIPKTGMQRITTHNAPPVPQRPLATATTTNLPPTGAIRKEAIKKVLA